MLQGQRDSRSSRTTTASPAGGPVYLPKVYNGKNKTFFFMDWERTKVKNFTSTSFTTLPVPDFKQGDFSRLLNPSFTSNTNSGTNLAQTDALDVPLCSALSTIRPRHGW